MKFVFAILILIAPPFSVPIGAAQSTAAVEVYGPVLATQVYDSLGTNINPANEWEYQAAQSAHITWGRFDCAWQSTEIQKLPQNTSGGYVLPRQCASGLALGKTYGVRTMMDALYGAPYGKVAGGVTAANAAKGANSISIQVTSGSLGYLVPGQSYIKVGSKDVSAKHAYAGTLITSVSGNFVTLASALTTDIPAGSSVTLNLQLYAPVLIPANTNYLTNPSVRAYEGYVHFLQTQIAASGMPGRISIWNEPPWSGDPWDVAANLYDNNFPSESRIGGRFGVELAYAALALPPVPGALLDNGYTNKTATGSILHPAHTAQLTLPNLPHQVFASESFHPYGNNPEDAAWDSSCIETHKTPSMLGSVFKDCTPVGESAGANTKWQAAFSAAREGNPGMVLGITETGFDRVFNRTASETQGTRFDLRQFLVFAGLGVHPIIFYRLAGDAHLEWMHQDHSPYPVYTSFQNLMADMQTIAHPPAAPYGANSIPTVAAYTGTYPLATTLLVGSRTGDKANSFLVYAWQRSYSSGRWIALPSPDPASVSLSVPAGLRVAAVKDTVTSSPIPCKVAGQTVTMSVADNPIEILLTPASSTSLRNRCGNN